MRATSIVILFLLMLPATLCAQGDAVKAVDSAGERGSMMRDTESARVRRVNDALRLTLEDANA